MHISNSSTAGFAPEPHGLDLVFRRARLASRQWLSPTYVRVRLSGDELLGFTSPGADDHIRVFFPTDAAASISELREAPSREYTPLAWDSHAGWLDLEFAIHGTSGVAQGIGARWAASAPIGAHVGVGGPRGSKVLVGHPDS